MGTPRSSITLGPKAMSELLKPARLEVFESLQTAGPATVAELARRLGRPADSLYYHLRKLVEVGVAQASEPDRSDAAPAAGRKGARFAVAARAVTMKLDLASKQSRNTWASSVGAVLRLAEREVRAAIDRGAQDPGRVRTEGPRRTLLARRTKARLSDRALRRVNELQSELYELLAEHADSTSGQPFATTPIMTPLEERTR